VAFFIKAGSIIFHQFPIANKFAKMICIRDNLFPLNDPPPDSAKHQEATGQNS
jgi:hypothetical protein